MPPLLIIAEDNPPVSYLLKTYAQMCGFQAVYATVGERVIEMVVEVKPEFILLNINLPGKIRGWETLVCLKDTESTRNIPVVVYHVKDEEVPSSYIEKADAVLPIPVLFEGFQDTLTRVGIQGLSKKDNPGG